MKSKRSDVLKKSHKIPEIRYENQEAPSLTSFAGLVIYQKLFDRLGIKSRLAQRLGHISGSATYGAARVFLWLIVHLLLGYRHLSDRDFYSDDPLVKRLLGLAQLPDTSTISRTLGEFNEDAVKNLREYLRQLVLERLLIEQLPRVTLDFDGSVFSTGRHAEGTAIGFNKKKIKVPAVIILCSAPLLRRASSSTCIIEAGMFTTPMVPARLLQAA